MISSQREAREALELIDSHAESIVEIEAEMEEKHDLQTLRRESVDMKKAVDDFMAKKDVEEIDMGSYKVKLIRRVRRSWNGEKLRGLVDKATWLRITTQTPDPEKIDEMVREKKLDRKVIADAYEEIAEKPHTRRYYASEKSEDEEESRLKEAMGS